MKKILVVDNDQFILKFMNDLLTEMGHEVETASDGLSALDIMEGYSPDVVFLDLVMPNIGGKELCQIIRGTEKLKNTFVIILSAAFDGEMVNMAGIGADLYIGKGPLEEMTSDIQEALDLADHVPSQPVTTGVDQMRSRHTQGITKELLSVKRHFEIILDSMSDGIVELAADGRITYANSAALKLMNMPEQTLLGSSLVAFFDGGDRFRLQELLNPMDGEPKAITDESPADLFGRQVTLTILPVNWEGFSTVVVLNDITERKLSENALKRSRDELEERVKERTLELVQAMDDLKLENEERKRAESALRGSEEKYRNILESIEEGYYELDLGGNFVFVNDALCKILGHSRDELLQMSFRECTKPETAKELFQGFDEIYRTGSPFNLMDYAISRKNGSVRDVEMSVSLIRDSSGKPAGYRGVMRDITEKRKLRAQLVHAQKMESIGIMSNGVAHNFRNILSAISSSNEILETTCQDDERLMDIAGTIREQVDSGVQLIGKLLQFSRPSAGTHFKTVNLAEEIEGICNLISQSFSKNLDLEMNLPETILVMGDPFNLGQVIMNLCINAVDAMPDGGKLRIEATEEGGRAKVTIEDTGQGMERETLERCFDPFFTTKEADKGTGLGLSTSYGIVKEHGGEIRAYSEIGKGTVFNVYLPLAQAGERDGDK